MLIQMTRSSLTDCSFPTLSDNIWPIRSLECINQPHDYGMSNCSFIHPVFFNELVLLGAFVGLQKLYRHDWLVKLTIKYYVIIIIDF